MAPNTRAVPPRSSFDRASLDALESRVEQSWIFQVLRPQWRRRGGGSAWRSQKMVRQCNVCVGGVAVGGIAGSV